MKQSNTTCVAMADPSTAVRSLIHGDNLDIFRRFGDDLDGMFDLIYIDPPFATSNEFRVGETA